MAKENLPKKPKFNTYWVYGLVIVGLLAVSMFGDSSSQTLKKTNISEFERFLNDGDVMEVVVYNKNLAKVSLTEKALEKSIHSGTKTKNLFGQENIKGPHYQFEVGNLELFQRKLEKAESNGITFRYDFTTIENRWMDIFLSFLPILLIVGVWIFLMRRMSWTRIWGTQLEKGSSPTRYTYTRQSIVTSTRHITHIQYLVFSPTMISTSGIFSTEKTFLYLV